MSLRHILLGLAERECSGYDVKKEFDTSLRNFWRAELSQIYPQLQKLEKDGLLNLSDQGIEITPSGRLLLRNIAMTFDRYIDLAENDSRFSKAI